MHTKRANYASKTNELMRGKSLSFSTCLLLINAPSASWSSGFYLAYHGHVMEEMEKETDLLLPRDVSSKYSVQETIVPDVSEEDDCSMVG